MKGSHLCSLLQSCRSLKSLKSIHACLVIDGSVISSDIVLNRLLRFYGRFGAIDHARKLFDEISQPNGFLWTALIHGHIENRLHQDALQLFCLMRQESMPLLNFTLSLVLKALSRQLKMQDGESVHGLVLKLGFDSDSTVQNSVIDLYSRCGEMDIARQVFDGMHCKDIVSWNSVISGYCSNCKIDIACELFERMPERNIVSWTAMISGQGAAGNMAAAQALFDRMPVRDSAAWNALIAGYTEAGDLSSAYHIFNEMPEKDIRSWNSMIRGLCKAGELNLARDMFDRMPHRNAMSWSMMLDGFISAGEVQYARCLFDQMPEKNLVSWSAMISCYAKHAQPNHALKLFQQFKKTGIKPDETFLLVIISTCAQIGVLNTAEEIIHEYILHSQLSNLRLVACLIDMYSKCGSIKKALQVFESPNRKDLVCYSAMIQGFANHGMGRDAINLLSEMLQDNIKPDGVAFIGVLSACSHAGFIDEGKRYFKLMTEKFGIQPSEKHYACMVDLLSRAGNLDEAHKLIRDMPIQPHAGVWGALLSACRFHCNVELAEVAAGHLFKIEPDNSGNYVILSSIYAADKRWDHVSKVRKMIRERRVRKNRGSSWIELDLVVHEFVMGGTLNLDSSSIYPVLDLLFADVRNFGSLMDSKCIIEW